MTYLFLLDIFIYNVTPYNIPLFLIILPYQKNFKTILIFMSILTFFEYRYILLMLIIYLIYSLNKILNKHLQNSNKLYLIELIIDYSLYFILVNIVKQII